MSVQRQEALFLRRLGNSIRKQREGLNWSQERLAHESGLHRTYIGGVERGERNVSALALRRISQAMHISVADLFALGPT